MKLSEHADHTERVVGIRGEDIHKWIDGFFDIEGFDDFVRTGKDGQFDPYGHRKFRHCREALEDAIKEFEGKYTREQIVRVFETHLKDDYDGYIPVQSDFEDGKFREKYHEAEDSERILNESELKEYFAGKRYAAEKKHQKNSGNLKFWLSILVPTVAAILLFVASIFALVLPQFRSNLISQKKVMIRELTVSASSIIHYYIQQVEDGEWSLNEAQQRAAEEIRDLRYGEENKDYYWITDMHPRMIMHPYRQDLTGKDLSYYLDEENKSGKLLFVEFVKLVKESNEGYLEYYWQWKDDADTKAPKLSYVRGIPEWGWIIGTGIYINDVHAEIQNLTHKILVTFGFITLGLIVILIYIVRQSLRIEHNRQKAESGLIEAKERYRALVEASNEGYVMELEGDHVYSNLTFQRITGYNEEESQSSSIWEELLLDSPENQAALHTIKKALKGKTVRGEFEACIQKKNGEPMEVLIQISRIFFSEKNGHVISLRAITRKKTASFYPSHSSSQSLDRLVDEIKKSETEGHLIRTLNRLSSMVGQRLEDDSDLVRTRNSIATIYHETVIRHIQLDLKNHELPTVHYSFVSLGSAARQEMTFFSDQDHALIFEVPDGEKLDEVRHKFLQFANRICKKLDHAGYPFCHGGIMASNPKWCLSLEEWKQYVSKQIQTATPESIREVNIFMDMQHLHGDTTLVDQLQKHIFEESARHQVFFNCYAHNCLFYKLPLNMLGQLKTEQKDGEECINIKECITLLVLLGRIYSLKHGVSQLPTIERLQTLATRGIIQKRSVEKMVAMFNFFWRLRFNHQLGAHGNLRKVDEFLRIHNLTEDEMSLLKSYLSALSRYQKKISYDFLGVDPNLAE